MPAGVGNRAGATLSYSHAVFRRRLRRSLRVRVSRDIECCLACGPVNKHKGSRRSRLQCAGRRRCWYGALAFFVFDEHVSRSRSIQGALPSPICSLAECLPVCGSKRSFAVSVATRAVGTSADEVSFQRLCFERGTRSVLSARATSCRATFYRESVYDSDPRYVCVPIGGK